MVLRKWLGGRTGSRVICLASCSMNKFFILGHGRAAPFVMTTGQCRSTRTHTKRSFHCNYSCTIVHTHIYTCICMDTHIYTKPSTHSADEIPKTLRISFYHNVKKSWVADDWWSCSPFSISAVHTIMVLAKNKRMFTVIFSADCVCVRKYLVRIVCAIHGIICCRVGKSVCTMGQHNMLWMYERVYTNREWK